MLRMPVGSDRGGGLLQPLWHANSGTMRQLQEPESFGQQVLPFVRHGFFYRNRQQRTYDWSGVEEPSSFVRCVSPMQENQRGWIYILLLVRPPSRREIAGAFSGSSGEAGCVVRTSGSIGESPKTSLGQGVPAGFWIRFVAFLIDGLMLYLSMCLPH